MKLLSLLSLSASLVLCLPNDPIAQEETSTSVARLEKRATRVMNHIPDPIRGALNVFLYSACHYDFPRAYTLHYFNGFLNVQRRIHGTCNDDELCFDRRDGSRRAAWCVGPDDIDDFRLDRMSSDSDDSFTIRAPRSSRSGSSSPDTFSLMTTGPFNNSEFAPSQVRLSISVQTGPRASLRHDVVCQNVARCSAEVPVGGTVDVSVNAPTSFWNVGSYMHTYRHSEL